MSIALRSQSHILASPSGDISRSHITQTLPECYYYPKAGFIDHPDVIDGKGTKKIDNCLIGTLKGSSASEPNSVVLAFRGTLPPSTIKLLPPSLLPFIFPPIPLPIPIPLFLPIPPTLLRFLEDWLNDFEAVLTDFTKMPGVKVHKGFHDTVTSFFGQEIVKKHSSPVNPWHDELYITGHSKGGALAHVAALLLRTMHPNIPLAGVISFEAPRAGDASFAAAYNALKINSLRYEFQDDIVPHLPLTGDIAKFIASMPLTQVARKIFYPKSERSLTFEHVGELRFIDWLGNVVVDKPGLQEERNKRLRDKLVPFGALAILRLLYTQHSVSCETKVAWKAICRMEPCKF